MYGRKKTNSVDQARLEIFVTKYKPKKGSASLNQIQAKKLDSSIMPPCLKVFHQKIKRCIYVTNIWTNSLRTKSTPHLPTSFGWMLDKAGHIPSNGLKAMLHQRSLKWLRTILVLVMLSFPILKYKDACYKITVTAISIIQPSFWFPFWFLIFSDSNMIKLWKLLQCKLCELDIMGSSHL